MLPLPAGRPSPGAVPQPRTRTTGPEKLLSSRLSSPRGLAPAWNSACAGGPGIRHPTGSPVLDGAQIHLWPAPGLVPGAARGWEGWRLCTASASLSQPLPGARRPSSARCRCGQLRATLACGSQFNWPLCQRRGGPCGPQQLDTTPGRIWPSCGSPSLTSRLRPVLGMARRRRGPAPHGHQGRTPAPRCQARPRAHV